MIETEHSELKTILNRNTKLLEENNRLLRKLRSYEIWGFWLRIIWYALLIGMPFALYFYILEPYFEALGSSYSTFETGMREIPGWKQFTEALERYQAQ